HVQIVRDRSGSQRGRATRVDTANGQRALIVVLMAAHHEIDAVAVEEGQPLLPDAEISAVVIAGGGDRYLMHADHDPVDLIVVAPGLQCALKPALLCAMAVAMDVGGAAVLVANVVVVEGNDLH